MKSFFGLLLCAASSGLFAAAENSMVTAPVSASSDAVSYKFNALLQAWTVSDRAASSQNTLNFRLRRAELKLSGNAGSTVRYFVMADPAKTIHPDAQKPQDGKILQDFGVGFTLVPGLEVVAGQFKILTNAESLSSSAELIIPERSAVARVFGDVRDLIGFYFEDGGTGPKTRL